MDIRNELFGRQKGSILTIVILTVVIGFILLLATALPASALGLFPVRDPAIATTAAAAGQVTCSSWGAPGSYQADLTKAAAKVGIQPALLGAIFLDEHANGWPDPSKDPGSDGVWASGGNGQGPFQIETWDTYWQQVVEMGYNEGRTIGNADATKQPNVQNMYDSGIATAVSVLVGFKKYNIDPMTVEQKYVMYAGLQHNAGAGPAQEWASAGFDINKPPSIGWGTGDYALRTWTNFQKLNTGCTQNGASPITNLTPDMNSVLKLAQYYMNLNGDALVSAGGYHTQATDNCVIFNSSDGKTCQLGSNGTGAPWCASFVSWVFSHVYGSKMVSTASVDDMRKWFQDPANGHKWLSKFTSPPTLANDVNALQPGDLMFEFGNEHHVGIVESVDTKDQTFCTIDGNYGSGYGVGEEGDTVVESCYRNMKEFNGNANMGIGRW